MASRMSLHGATVSSVIHCEPVRLRAFRDYRKNVFFCEMTIIAIIASFSAKNGHRFQPFFAKTSEAKRLALSTLAWSETWRKRRLRHSQLNFYFLVDTESIFYTTLKK
jgi:hypothetical protein